MGSKRIEKKLEYYSFLRWDWKGKTLVLECITLFLLIFSLFAFIWKRVLFHNTSIESEVWGQFGDFVGGVIGSLIAYIKVVD